jgi:hypothetical protein
LFLHYPCRCFEKILGSHFGNLFFQVPLNSLWEAGYLQKPYCNIATNAIS